MAMLKLRHRRDILWFACDLPGNQLLLRHRFACDKCAVIEHIAVPFTGPAPEAAWRPDLGQCTPLSAADIRPTMSEDLFWWLAILTTVVTGYVGGLIYAYLRSK